MSQCPKNCKTCGKEYLIIGQEQTFYEKKKLAEPVDCFACRRERRASMRNKRTLYKRLCDKCGKELMSTYSTDSPYVIYCENCYVTYVN